MAETILQVLKRLTGITTARTIAEILPELIEGSHYGADIFSPKGKVSTVSALPATGNQIGDMYHVEEDQSEYAWWPTELYPNGHWEFIGTVGGSGLPDVTDSDAEKTLVVDEEGNWEVDYPSPNWLLCTWTRTVNGNSVSWSCNRTYNQMIANRNVLHRQVIFQYENQSVIATFCHEPGESDYFVGHLIVKLDGQYSKVTLYCISGLGVSATEERIVPADAVNSVNGQTGAVALDADDVGAYAKPSGGIPKTDLAAAVQSSLGKADTALQSYTESDPTVPPWAKASSKPSYTAQEVGALPDSTVIPTVPTDEINANTAARHTHNNKGVLDGISLSNVNAWTAKQDAISDLSTIRSGASAGATAVQPNAISDMATKTWVGQQGYLTQHQDISGKLNKNQGAANAGKFMVVGSNGDITAVTMQTWQGGSY